MRLQRLLATPLVFLLACKQPTPADQLDTVMSWLGTAGMVGDAWLRHTTPDRYTRETLELSHETLAQIRDDLLKAPVPGVDTASLDSVLTRSGDLIVRMARFVEARNSPAFAITLDSLRADQRVVKLLADNADSAEKKR